ncbi:tenascin-X isoform X2 [Rhipicephalus microplus]|uniref:tenascin-X isoform X2 n=1 Tax=Rhipicephalus microplus TaxID=6941 RepID=UPI003F6AE315
MDLSMDDGKLPPYAKYHCRNDSVTLVEADQEQSQALPKKARGCRCTARKSLAVAITFCLITTVAAVTLFVLQRAEILPKAERFKTTGLPDVSKLVVEGVKSGFITLSWRRPKGRFDYYTVEVTEHDAGVERAAPHRLCANGTIIRPDQTEVTCGPFEPCAKLSFTVRTHFKGPPEHGSLGVTVAGTLILPEEADPPKKITMVEKSPSLTLLWWEPPAKIWGRFLSYAIRICTTFESCGRQDDTSNCTEQQTYETWLNFQSSVDTKYCVMVVTRSQCAGHVLSSRPAAAEVFTSLPVLPDVTNLNLVAADNHYITIAWDRPRLNFDFYWLDVSGGYENGNVRRPMRTASVCPNGTIIRPQQTQITCGPFDSCSSVDVTVRTYNKGPPELLSAGTTLSDIFIGAQDPSEPRSIKMVAKSPAVTRLEWQAPANLHGVPDVYCVKVCEVFASCDENQNISECAKYETRDEWLNINTTADTSYCILITAKTQCGLNVLTSLPASLEFRTPLFELPDVSNLALVHVKRGYVTLSWQRPKGRFDYYSVEVTEDEASNKGAAQQWRQLCSNGTIIRPDQTEVTCGPFEPCAKLSCTVRTHFNGPPEHRSLGVTVADISIPAEDPIPATNVTITPETPSQTRLHWSQPQKKSGTIESYIVKICSTFESCDPDANLTDCAQQVTTEMWTLFDTKEDTSYCVLIAAKIRCGTDEISSRQVAAEIRTPLFDLPDAKDFRILSAVNNTVTIAWDKPAARFDYYLVYIAAEDHQPGHDELGIVGSCGNGTILHPNQTQFTYTHIRPCGRVNITLRAHRNGPTERTSRGVSLQEVFIPGEEPDPPRNITIVVRSPSLTRLRWEPPTKVSGRLLEYSVKICTTFKSCTRDADAGHCTELQAYDSWLDFHSRVDTKYCVMVSASSQCGENVLHGQPAIEEIRTPSLETPDVMNLTAGVESRYITLSWQRPQGRFDYYIIEITQDGNKTSSQHNLGLCINGSIVHPDQSELSCGPYEPCTKVVYTIRTHLNGPPERSSPGVRSKEVFIPAEELADVTNLMTAGVENGFITLTWQRPHGRFDYYSIAVTEDLTGSKNNDQQMLGLCANGTIIRPEQTQVTCGPFKPCTMLSCTVHTHLNGPPELMSSGVSVKDIVIPGQEPPQPKNVKIVPQSSSLTQLQWDNHDSDTYAVKSYIVHICRTFRACGPMEILADCEQEVTPQALVTFNSTADTLYCILVTEKRTCGVREFESQPAVAELRTPIFELPDVSNLTADVRNGYITLTWNRPPSRFDYYSIEAFDDDVSNKNIDKRTLDLCANGTIVHRDQTQVTCGPFEPCTKLSCTVRTHLSGQPERISSGVTLNNIFIPAEVPHPPRNISVVAESKSLTQLHWNHPDDMAAVIESYNVKVCRTFRTCGQVGNFSDCEEHETQQTSVTLNTTEDTSYCILVSAKAWCGMDEINSRPTVAELRTPIFDLPEVTNLHIVSVGADFFTAEWGKPKVNFDYYWIEVTSANNSRTNLSQDVVGSCANGTIIRPDQTQVTCSRLEPCVNVVFKVRTHISKPSARTSPGVALTDFFIPGKVHVKNLTVSFIGDDNFTLTWQKGGSCLEYYTVKVTDNSDGDSGNASNGLVSCNNGAVITSSQTSVTCDQPLTCANVTITVKPHVKGVPDSPSNEETLPGVYLSGKTPPPVTDLKLVKITHSFFTVTYRAPKKCYADFQHTIRPSTTRARARIGDCHLKRAIDRITATCLIGACGKVNIAVQTKAIAPSRRVSAWARLTALDTKRKCLQYHRV